MLAASATLLRHDCDATRGDSSSPILVRDGAVYRIVAIHVASTTHDGQPAGLAVLIPPDLPQ